MSLTMYAQFEEASNQRMRKNKIQVLHKHKTRFMLELLDLTFNPRVKFLIPEGEVIWIPSEDSEKALVSRLPQECKSLRDKFTSTGKYPNMNQRKRNNLFSRTLESIHPNDAKLLLEIRYKRLPFTNLTKDIFEEAFPELAQRWNK